MGYDKKMGARPLSRKIDELIRVPLSKRIIFDKIKNANVAAVIKEGKVDFVMSMKQTASVDNNGIIQVNI